MEKPDIRKLDVSIPEWVAKRWCVVCYLIINWKVKELVKQVQVEPEEKFYRLAADLVYEYAVNDKMPPKFRAGDYIAMQNYVRGMG